MNMVIITIFSYRTAQCYFHRTSAFKFLSWFFGIQHPIQKVSPIQDRTHLGQTTGSSDTPIFLYPCSCDLYFPPYRQMLQVSVWSTKLFVLTFSSCKHLWPSMFWKQRALSLAQLEQGHPELTVLSSHHMHSWYQSLTRSTPKKSPAHFKLKSPSVHVAAF